MKNNIKWIYIMGILIGLTGCKKSEFLDKKPATNLLTPTSLSDYQGILENTNVMNLTGGLNQLSADEYYVADADWASGLATERNAYIWAKDIYGGDVAIADWNRLYTQVFYANSVIDGLSSFGLLTTPQGQYLKGWALFARAYAFYDLTRTFCKAYDANTAGTDLGIPIRLKSGIDNIAQRSSLQKSFDQIFSDLAAAIPILPDQRPSPNLNRPSKTAAFAFLARIYLDMRNYTQAENYADQALGLYSTLIDYNNVDATTSLPFSTTNDELIYNTEQVSDFGDFTPVGNLLARIPTTLLSLYNPADLRFPIFFGAAGDGTYYRKPGYNGQNSYPFTGLATDEMYIIKAECLARNGQTSSAMDELNLLLIKRFKKGIPYVPLTASNSRIALNTILIERSKEMVWRGTRWYDLKRLNLEGANITLTRVVNGTNYTLPPNDVRWVMPIPSDEISLSGITQNPR
jgi:hypothetical protein